MQIQPGQRELVFSNAPIMAPRMQQFAGVFRSAIYAADTQIDYTGHGFSAIVNLTRHRLALE